MVAAPLTKKAVGLWTATNRYDVPEGALVQAMNVLIRRDGVIAPRWAKAQKVEQTRYSSGGATVRYWHRQGVYRDALYLAGLEYGSSSKYYVAATQGDFGNVTPVPIDTGVEPPDGITAYGTVNARGTPFFDLEFLEAGRNLYYTTFYGLKRFDDTTTTASRKAGNVPCALSCFPRPVQLAAGTLVRSANVTTATWPYAHGFVVGVTVAITTSGDANFPTGTFTVATTPSATTFTYADVAANATSAANTTMGAAQFVGSSGFITTNEQVAYRACLVEYDENGTEHIGEMSPRVEIINAAPYIGTAVNKNVQAAVLFPTSGPARRTKFQVHRSKKGTTAPSDELALVYERYLTDAERTQGYAWFTDITPDTLRGAFCYTNETQEGLEGNNSPPPAAKTIALWKDRLVCCNTAGRSAVELQLLSTDSTAGGLATSDIFTIVENPTSSTYTAQATVITTSTGFLRSSGGTASQDVKQTVHSLCDTINWGYGASSISPLATWRAGYLASANDFPGRFYVQRTVPDFHEPGSATANARIVASALTASGRTAFAPELGAIATTSGAVARVSNVTTVNTTITATLKVGEYITVYDSVANFYAGTPLAIAGTNVAGRILSITAGASFTMDNSGTDGTSSVAARIAVTQGPVFNPDRNSNRVALSKVRTFEAFPGFNYVAVGTDGNIIQKAAPSGDSLLLFTNEGLFRLEEAGETFSVEVVDPTARIWARDTVQPYKDKVVAWLLGGVAVCDANGAEYISKPIEDKLLSGDSQFSLYSCPLTQRAIGIVNSLDELYELRVSFTAAAPTGTVPWYSTTNLTYNLLNQTWTQDNIPVVSESVYNGLRYIIQYLSTGTETPLYQQRSGIWYGGDAIPDILMTLNAVGSTITSLGSGRYQATLPLASVTDDGSPVTAGVNHGDLYLGNGTGGLYEVVTAAYDGGSSEWTIVFKALYGTSLLDDQADGLTGIVTPSDCTIEWAPITLVEENRLKLFQEVCILFGCAATYETNVKFYTELVTTEESVDAGNFASQFDGSVSTVETYLPVNLRLTVPRQHRRGQQLSVILNIPSAGPWTVLGLSVKADKQDTRVMR